MTKPHDWKPSTLGHGESMCRACFITNREAAALGLLNDCDAPEKGTADGKRDHQNVASGQ
jgi:hypothetical protein